MGCCCSSSPPPKTLHMMFFIITTTIFFLLSLHITHILISEASLDAAGAGYFNAHGLQQKLQYMMESGKVEKVAGEDEIEEKENLFVQKFRALLGLKNFNIRSSSTEYVSPAPSPSAIYEAEGQPPTPAPAPAPAPAHRIHVHSHPPRHQSNHMPSLFKIPKEHKGKGRFKTILVVVIVTAAAAFLVCVIGLIWVVSRKFRKSSQSSARPVSVHPRKARTRGISKYRSSVKPASKVSLNPALDLLYLNSLEGDIEQQATYIKQTPETVNSLANHSTPEHRSHEREESKQEVTMKPESDNASSSSTREIMSVHEDVESERYESDGGNSSTGDKIIPIEWHSSDDESFHSFIDSHSSSVRLSNASAGTLTDVSEISPSNVTKTPPSPPSAPIDVDIQQTTPIQNILSPTPTEQRLTESSKSCNEETMAISCPSYPDKNFTPPPPPPSPLPPRTLPFPRMRSITTNTSSCSAGIASKASISSTPPNLPTTTKPDSSPGSKQRPETTQSELPPTPQRFPKSSQATSSIPTPPCPPPFQKGNSSPGKGPPPPPCPPTFLKGNSSSAKGPPLPPSQLPPYTPVGKDGVPLPKLKPLHWDKVRAAPEGNMVWDKIRSSSFELDEEMIESLFGYNLQCTTKNEEAKSKTPSPSKHVLEPKRLQNITILSKALNANAEQICNALMRGDGLCLQQLEALAKMVLTKEEEAKLFGYKGDINELGSAERFVRIVLTIPFAFLRVETMLYRETFEDEVVHLRGSFSMLEEACKELRSSRLFLKLLEAVLKTGNRMNVGTIRGGARAFKLDTLLKLSDVKGTDGKTTLLHFVVQEIVRSEGIRVSDSIMGKINQKNKTKSIEEREEDYRKMGLDLVSGLSTELYNVKKTATIDLDVLANSVSNLSEGMAKLQHLVEKDLSMDDKSANFVHTMKTFLRYAARNIKELKEDEDRVLLHVRQITEYFHGHVSKDEANPLRIFVIVRDFLGMLDHVCKELRSLKVPNSNNPLAPFR